MPSPHRANGSKKYELESLYPAVKLISVDTDVLRKPCLPVYPPPKGRQAPLAICENVVRKFMFDV
jgi:hypothetical protein